MALTLCVCHLTDGFCNPNGKPDCKCIRLATECLKAMKTVGVKPVWVFDKEHPNV